jgi:hypothetical protein
MLRYHTTITVHDVVAAGPADPHGTTTYHSTAKRRESHTTDTGDEPVLPSPEAALEFD